MAKKTREELIEDFQSELIDLVSMTIEVEGYSNSLEYHPEMEDLPQRLHFILPEYSTYYLIITYKVKSRPLKKLTYSQVVKKHGIPFASRDLHMNDHAEVNTEDNPTHLVRFPPDKLPGGRLIRGTYPAHSKFYEEGKTIFSCDWLIEVVKKDEQPRIGGFS